MGLSRTTKWSGFRRTYYQFMASLNDFAVLCGFITSYNDFSIKDQQKLTIHGTFPVSASLVGDTKGFFPLQKTTSIRPGFKNYCSRVVMCVVMDCRRVPSFWPVEEVASFAAGYLVSGLDEEAPIHLAPPKVEISIASCCQHSCLWDPPAGPRMLRGAVSGCGYPDLAESPQAYEISQCSVDLLCMIAYTVIRWGLSWPMALFKPASASAHS
jgi:hypothetical protein